MTDIGSTLEDIHFNRGISFQTTRDLVLTKIRGIFTYEGLPLTIPHRHLERFLTQTGHAVIYEHEGDLFATNVQPSGDEDMYGDRHEMRIEHRYNGQRLTLERTIGVDAVMMRNDPDCVGLMGLIDKFCLHMAQSDISALRVFVDLRSPYIIQAKDENAYKSIQELERGIREGDTTVVFAEEFSEMEGIGVHPLNTVTAPATQLIELTQYITSRFYSELGITLNNNMKSQYVNEMELERSTGSSLVAVMLESRMLALRDIEALFGVEIGVRLSEEWNDEQEKDDAEPQSDGAPEAAAGGPGDDQEGGGENRGEEEPDDADEPEADSDDPEDHGVEEATAEELKDAEQAMMGEEVHDDEADDDQAADDADPRRDGDQD